MKLRGRTVDQYGRVIHDVNGLVDLLMAGQEISGDLLVCQSPGVTRYNDLCRELDHPRDQVTVANDLDVSVEQWDEAHQEVWFIPDSHANIDVREWLLERCTTEAQVTRVLEEWQIFEQRDMINMLRFLIFLVDDFRQRSIVWGVGRGSSVASYCLFLIGIHKVDSLAYDLDIREFLK